MDRRESLENYWRQALLIRRTEERLLELFAEGRLNGTLHTCIGQEWSAVAVCAALKPDDWVFSNHRGHGHFLARTGDVEGLIAEIMGKVTGVCGGYGGSQHLRANNYFSNGILGGMLPVAAGVALAGKWEGGDSIATIFMGDGALGEGLVYETFNLVSKWQVPMLIVVESNGFAQSTDCQTTLAGSIRGRAAAFDIEHRVGSTWEWRELLAEAGSAVQKVRTSRSPVVLEVRTFRLKAHSKGDDNRDAAWVSSHRDRDPIDCFLRDGGSVAQDLDHEVRAVVKQAVADASAAGSCKFHPTLPVEAMPVKWRAAQLPDQRLSDATYESLKRWLGHEKTFLLGEDIEGPYGGAFKITRDLSQIFPDRVRNTPISEAAITGIATGMALRGWRPMVEIMFGDFTTLVFDQLIQHACKFRAMFGGGVSVPLVIRSPMGGRRGYGPTHSQSIEKHFVGVPNLTVLAVNHRLDVSGFYDTALSQKDPVLVIENKVLYTRRAGGALPVGMKCEWSVCDFPCTRLSWEEKPAVVTLFCYGGMLAEAEAAMEQLFDEHEIAAEIICPSCIHPIDPRPLLESVHYTGRLVTCEEGTKTAAVAAEVLAQIAESGVPAVRCRRLSFDGVIPSAFHAEQMALVEASRIVAAARELTK
ncbi:MAG: pyruvate dehydrogenase [Betaproteobacteria bacterium]|nr:pyruvate dehydrogenase [Betaproteobacteria bacterium]